jgi:hypothetical protein
MKQPATSQSSVPSPLRARSASIDTATLDLLATWRLQDATADPQEILSAEEEVNEVKRVLHANRLGFSPEPNLETQR